MIEINELSFGWAPDNELLRIPALTFARGEKVFVKGPSGSGKSTLLGLLGGVYKPQSGSIRILDTTVSALEPAKRDQFRADHIGFIFQMFNLLPYLSVLENVSLACHFSALRRQRLNAQFAPQKLAVKQAAIELLGRLGLADGDLPARKVTELSVGQQQRVAVARALLGQPELIIADEPTSALDADSRNDFLSLLMQESERANSTLIFVSHDSQLQTRFDRSIALQEINLAAGPARQYE